MTVSAEIPSTCGAAVGEGVLEPGEVDRLLGAAGRVGARIEKQHELLAGIVGERDAAAAVARQIERRGLWRPRQAPSRRFGSPAMRLDFNGFDAALWEAFGEALLAATLEAAFEPVFGASFEALADFCYRRLAGFGRRRLGRRCRAATARPSRSVLQACWRISCAFSWTYAFLSSLSAGQPMGYCGSRPGRSDSRPTAGQV